VVKFADAAGEVALLAESLGEAQLIGDGFTEDLRIVVDAGAVGVKAGEHRIATGAAERVGAVGAVEADAAGGELVDVRRAREGIAVGAEHGVEVVGDEEEDVFLGRGGGSGGVRARWGGEEPGEGHEKCEQAGTERSGAVHKKAGDEILRWLVLILFIFALLAG
jgi:hypothetical protein